MAEALLVHRSGGRIDARSAGSNPKPVSPHAVSAMASRGIDISGCASKHLNPLRRTRFDKVVTLCDRVREVCPEFPAARSIVHWSVPDPSAQASEHAPRVFAATADELTERIDFLIYELADN